MSMLTMLSDSFQIYFDSNNFIWEMNFLLLNRKNVYQLLNLETMIMTAFFFISLRLSFNFIFIRHFQSTVLPQFLLMILQFFDSFGEIRRFFLVFLLSEMEKDSLAVQSPIVRSGTQELPVNTISLIFFFFLFKKTLQNNQVIFCTVWIVRHI